MATGEIKKECTKFEDGLSLCASLNRSSIFFVVSTGEGADERSQLTIWDDF